VTVGPLTPEAQEKKEYNEEQAEGQKIMAEEYGEEQ
jgi:hypothetical protein